MTARTAAAGLAVVVALIASPTEPVVANGPQARVAPSASAPAEKYYVVGPPVNGQKEYLYAIAVKTLGNGNRYREIFQLNRGRPQPDGKWMTDPTILEPGWVLLLPPDANGPGVLTGPVPDPRPTTVPAFTPANSPRAAAPAVATSAADDPDVTTIRSVVIGLVVLVLVAALYALYRGRRQAVFEVDDRQAWPGPARPPALPLVSPPVPKHAPVRLRHRKPHEHGVPPRDVVPPAQPEPPAPAPAFATPAAPPPSPDPPGPVARVEPEDAPATLPILHAEVVQGIDRAAVRLVGAKGTRWPTASGWLTSDQAAPPSPTAVVVGHGDKGRLWIDLVLAPDVVTLLGDPDAGQRQAMTLINQLRTAGTDVTIVGDGFAGAAGCERVDTVRDVLAHSPPSPGVIVCTELDTASLRLVRELVNESGNRTIPIVVGDVPPSRWSIRMSARPPGSTSWPAGRGGGRAGGAHRHDEGEAAPRRPRPPQRPYSVASSPLP